MKLLLIFLIGLLPVSGFTQDNTYQVTWHTHNSCKNNISLSGQPGVIANTDMVKYADKIVILVDYRYDDLKNLTYTVLSGQTPETISHTPEQLGFEADKTTGQLFIEGKKLRAGSTKEMAYPFKLTFRFKNDSTCTLELGKTGVGGAQNQVVTPEVTLNILNGVQWESNAYKPYVIDSQLIAERNALILLDCAFFPSVQSAVYRKNKKGTVKKVSSFWVDDCVKIYLANFNPYLYSVKIDNNQGDFIYATAAETINPLKITDENKKDPADAASSAAATTSAQEKLKKYARAVNQMVSFIDFVKSNTLPDSRLLEQNKSIVLINLENAGLSEREDIEALYKGLQDTIKPLYKEYYETALRFGVTRAILRALTYTVSSGLAPIQIKPFDKITFKLAFTEKDGKQLPGQEYTYLIRGGLKVDQSFGVAFHGIFDQEFGLRSFAGYDTTCARLPNGEKIKVGLPDGTFKDSIAGIAQVVKREIIEAESPSKISIGLTTLTHLYYRTGKVNIGPEIGVCVDVYPQQNIRYLVGAGILFLDGRHRISLDIGCAFGKYNAFGNGQGYGTILTGADAQPNLVKKTGKSVYLGISYNLPIIPRDTQNAKPN